MKKKKCSKCKKKALLQSDEDPPTAQVYVLSDELRRLLGIPIATRSQLLRFLWQYIKNFRLQDMYDKRFFYPDDRLANIFGFSKIRSFAMGKYLKYHMRPFQPHPGHPGKKKKK